MLFAVPDKICGKFHFSENGGYLDEPYTEEEKKICDEFIEQMRQAKEVEIVIND